jgi:hypothetical protein
MDNKFLTQQEIEQENDEFYNPEFHDEFYFYSEFLTYERYIDLKELEGEGILEIIDVINQDEERNQEEIRFFNWCYYHENEFEDGVDLKKEYYKYRQGYYPDCPEENNDLECMNEKSLFSKKYYYDLDEEECDQINEWTEYCHDCLREDWWELYDPNFLNSKVYRLIYPVGYYYRYRYRKNNPDEFNGNNFVGELFSVEKEEIKGENEEDKRTKEVMEELYYRLNNWKTDGYTI